MREPVERGRVKPRAKQLAERPAFQPFGQRGKSTAIAASRSRSRVTAEERRLSKRSRSRSAVAGSRRWTAS